MKKFKIAVEWIVIILAVAIVASVVSIISYRAVINSDWYNEWQTKRQFEKVCDAVNDADSIAYIKIQNSGGDRDIYDIPPVLFDDMTCECYAETKDIEKLVEIFNEPYVAVFFKDGSHTGFNVCENGDIYWGGIKILCPSIAEWYSENK